MHPIPQIGVHYVIVGRLSVYIVMTLGDRGAKHQYFWNNSGKPQPTQTLFGTLKVRGDNIQEILGTVDQVGSKWEARTSRDARIR